MNAAKIIWIYLDDVLYLDDVMMYDDVSFCRIFPLTQGVTGGRWIEAHIDPWSRCWSRCVSCAIILGKQK